MKKTIVTLLSSTMLMAFIPAVQAKTGIVFNTTEGDPIFYSTDSYTSVEFLDNYTVGIVDTSNPGNPGVEIGPYTNNGTFNFIDQIYGNLPSNPDNNMIGQYPWTNFNDQVYGNTQVALTSTTFWDYYGKGNYEYMITVQATLRNGIIYTWTSTFQATNEYKLRPIANAPGEMGTSEKGGLYVSVGPWAGNAQTTNIEFYADYNARTQLTYQGDGRFEVNEGSASFDGALYTVIITIPSNDRTKKPNIKIWDDISITNTFNGYEFNPNYYPYEYEGKNYVSTKGKVLNGTWALQMNTMEAFRMINGENVFQYWANTGYNINPNVPLTLTYKENNPHYGFVLEPVLGQTSAQIVRVQPELDGAVLEAPLQYTPTFYNTETMPNYFDVLFRNPFKAGTAQQIGDANLYPNYVPGVQYVDLNQNIYIVDENNSWIIRYENGTLQLSDLAINQYMLDPDINNYEIKFSFDTEEEDYKTFEGNLTTGSVFEFNAPVIAAGNNYPAPGRGILTYWNNGATTVRDYKLTVYISVTFKNVSIVTMEVPFYVHYTGSPTN